MSDQFLAEIRIFGFNFAPTGWALCNGQLLPILQSTALFSLLGTYYGGDGRSTFALPNLQGQVAMNLGQGAGLSYRLLGEASGAETITLLNSEMPVHTHQIQAALDQGDTLAVDPTVVLAQSTGGKLYTSGAPTTQMAPQSLAPVGGGLPHSNMQPYLTLNFCIALQGIYPPRS